MSPNIRDSDEPFGKGDDFHLRTLLPEALSGRRGPAYDLHLFELFPAEGSFAIRRA